MKRSLKLFTILHFYLVISFLFFQCTRDNPFDSNSDSYISGKKPHVYFNDSLVTGYLLDTVNITVNWSDTAVGGVPGIIQKCLIDWNDDGTYSDNITGVVSNPLIISKVFQPQKNWVRIKVIDSDGDTSNIDSIWLEIKSSIPRINSIQAPDTIEKSVPFTINVNASDTGGEIVSYLWAVNENTFSKTTDSGSLSLSFDGVGENVIQVKARDNKKIESGLRIITIDVVDPMDSIGPEVHFLSPLLGDSITTNQCFMSVQIVDVSRVSSATINGTVAMQQYGTTWRGTVELVEGENTLAIEATDIKGNRSLSSIKVFYKVSNVDLLPPIIRLLAPEKWTDTINTSPVIVRLNVHDESGVANVLLNDESMKLDTTETYTAKHDLNEGNNQFIIKATDKKGNTRADTLSVFLKKNAIDSISPVLTISEPLFFQHITDTLVTVWGTVTDASKIFSVKVNDKDAKLEYPVWSTMCKLTRGINVIKVVATDSSVNRNSTPKSVTVLCNKPPKYTKSPNDTFVYLNSSIEFSASAFDDDTVLDFYITRSQLSHGSLSPLNILSGDLKFSYKADAIGTDTLNLFVKDPYGDVTGTEWHIAVLDPSDSTPKFTSVTMPEFTVALDTLRTSIHAIDPHGFPLVYSFKSSVPSGMLLDSISGAITWIPVLADTGVTAIVIQASNGKFKGTYTWSVKVVKPDFPPVLSPPGSQTVNENQKLQFSLNATDPNDDKLDFSFGSTIPAGARLDSNQFSWTPSFTDSGSHKVVFIVKERNRTPALRDSQTVTITVVNVNQKPHIINPGMVVGVAGKLLSYTLTASDADNDQITFSMLDAPQGAVLNGNTFTWTPAIEDVRTYSVRFIARDATLSDTTTITIKINKENRAPVLSDPGNKVTRENDLLQFTLSASDPDGDSLLYSLENAPTGSRLDGKVFSWRPGFAQADTYNITFTVRDNVSPPLSDTKTISIIVNDVNSAPVLTSPGDQAVDENVRLTFSLSAIDLDGNSLVYSMAGDLSSATLVNNVFAWTPSFDAAGSYRVTFVVADNGSPILSDSRSITITVRNVNRVPIFTDSTAKSVNENALLSFQLQATDPDRTIPVFIAATSLPTGATLNSNGNFSWTPTFTQAGAYPIRFIVQDTTNRSAILSDTVTLIINVNNVNRAPEFKDSTTRSVDENALLSFQLQAVDPDNTIPVYISETSLPSGATLNLNGTFTWTPTFTQEGAYPIRLIVQDTANRSAILSDTMTLTINVDNVNRAPEFKDSTTRSVDENALLSFQLQATDPDSTKPVFISETSLPSGATLDLNGTFTWTPTFTQAGAYPIRFIVQDTINRAAILSDTMTLTINVNNVNRAPEFKDSTAKTVDENSLLSFQLKATDPDSTKPVIISETSLPSGATLDLNGTFTWTPIFTQAGAYPIRFIVQDTTNRAAILSDTMTLTINVNNVNRAPEFTSSAAITGSEMNVISFNLSATDPDGDLLIFFSDVLPTGASLFNSGEFSWKPSVTDAGIHDVIFFVHDEGNGSANLSDTVTIRITVANTNPNVPTLTFPLNDASAQPVTIEFKWHKSFAATEYQLQIASDDEFNNKFEDITLSDTVKTISGLSNTTKYYWKVKALNPGGQSAWTETETLTTISVFQLTANATNGSVSPAQGQYDSAMAVTITASPDPGYHFVKWILVNGSAEFAYDSINPTTVKLLKNTEIEAQFEQTEYNVNVTSLVENGIINPSATIKVHYGDTIEIEANTSLGRVFKEWAVAPDNIINVRFEDNDSKLLWKTKVIITGDAEISAVFVSN